MSPAANRDALSVEGTRLSSAASTKSHLITRIWGWVASSVCVKT